MADKNTYEEAKIIFQTWDKDTLITDLLSTMSDEELKKFVVVNSETDKKRI